ncbi:hypothetical protein HZU73_05880 [Apis mellifera caucasica]|uniref:Uncharacterized protein LOC100577527 n=1 Tax=Apis mellifera TaxID=7460 RepID=A0A7M7GE53_APIME|nr:uncharacterized protein LOC100577527 [Apis mellifera]KAG6799077.1 hypothetical protein HZU73_05880 [Apis mellifera caucasica]KAG9432329.1 hypothetical protein HZU67_05576 [Apis mellifera carnica]|eukprot:XP_003250139.1 uncharacterized protein LOC100577527 [Apis mellifera]
MFRTIAVVLVVALPLIQASSIDISQRSKYHLEFTSKDAVQQSKSNPFIEERSGFIGDLTIGSHRSDEQIFYREVELNNPNSAVGSLELKLSVKNGILHYVSATNYAGSQAVICDRPNILGASEGIINIRLTGNTKATLLLIIAAH